jgi:HK97 family phage portal protein
MIHPLRSIREWNDRRRTRAQMRSMSGSGGWVPAAPILSGTFVTPESALCLAAVFAAVNVISRDLATFPRSVYRRLPSGGREVAAEMPQHDLIHVCPDGERDAFRFFAAIMNHVLTRGNGYAEIERDPADGTPVALHLLHPVKTLLKRTEAGALYYELDGDDKKRLAPENVLHFAGMGFNGLTGFSPIQVCRQTIGLAIAVEQFGASFFGSGAILKGLLKTAKKLGEMAVLNLRRTFGQQHQGSQNAHQVGILEEGMDWVNTQVTPEESQFLGTRQFQVVDIARIYSIPPHKIGDYSQAHLANVEEANLDYIVTTLHGWVCMIEAQLNSKLLTKLDRRQYEIGLDMSSMMRGNTGARTTWLQAMRNMGAIDTDEIRASEGLNPVGEEKGGKLLLVQGQYVPLDQVGRTPPVPIKTTAAAA